MYKDKLTQLKTNYDEMLFKNVKKEKERIQKEQEKATNVRQRIDIARQYYVLPDELAATQWAVDYMRAHTAEMQALWEEELKPAIIKFYELNKMEVA
jgi:hypothetical protein